MPVSPLIMKLPMNITLHILSGRMLWKSLVLSFISFVSLNGYAQQSSIQTLKLNEIGTGKELAFSDFKSKKAIVVIFFCNDCPYSTFYTERLKNLKKEYVDFQFLLINSSNAEFAPEESVASMSEFLKKNKMDIPYLIDKEKTAMKSFDAKRCPEVFVVTPTDWKVVYKGAIDNNPQVADDVSEFYLKNALDLIAKGSGVSTNNVRATGCIIK